MGNLPRKKRKAGDRPKAGASSLARRREESIAERRREERERARQRRSRRAGWRSRSGRKTRTTSKRKKAIGLAGYYAREAGRKPASPVRGSYIRSHTLVFPKVFSFIENPDGTLEFFETFIEKATARPKHLTFDQSKCEVVDFCAASLLNALATDLRTERKVKFDGFLPQAPELAEIVRATGLPKVVGLEYSGPEMNRHHSLRRGMKASERAKAKDINIQTTALAEYVDLCLQDLGFRLTDNEMANLAELVGEVIDNAERHSGREEWWIGGYLQRTSPDISSCHIVIFNFGKTIAQSLQELPPQSLLRDRIKALLDVHRPRFFKAQSKWTQDNLWTLFAIQEGVSRKNRSTTLAKDVGQGTVDMVQYFQNFADKDVGGAPVMCLISGRTHIRFDSRYPILPSDPTDPESYKIIAFNADNSLWEPPDDTAVRTLGRFFPGTLLSLKFSLSKDRLREVSL